MKIWQKYIFRQLVLTFAVILFCLFTVYVLIDFSIHGVRFLTRAANTAAIDLALYYLRQFAMHLDLFLPLAFLLSMYKVLFALNSHLELVALQMAGLSRKRLLFPFFSFAVFLSLVGWVNHEYFAGEAASAAIEFKAAHSKSRKRKSERVEHIQTLTLDDQSELVFQTFNARNKELSDVFWIRSEKDFWHIKTLSFSESPPTGYFADHLVRENKILQKQDSFEKKVFPEMPLNKNVTPKPFVPFESRPLSTLFSEAAISSVDAPSIKTHLHHKLALPLLPILILWGAAPFALTFSRQKRIFLIVSLSLFGFLVWLTLFDSLLILAENKVLPPAPAMWFCPALIALLSLRRFTKL